MRRDGALRLTTARYYTPSGRSIQAKGIDPDVLIEQDVPAELQAKVSATRIGEATLRVTSKQEDEAGKILKGIGFLLLRAAGHREGYATAVRAGSTARPAA